MKSIFIAVVLCLVFVSAVSAQTVPPGGMVNVDWNGSGCAMAAVTSCNSDNPEAPVLIYCNGVNVGTCGGGPYADFYSRGTVTDTITLVNTSDISSTDVTLLSVSCSSYAAQDINPTPTPIRLMTPPPTPQIAYAQDTGLPVPSFGGSLNDPDSPINMWIGYAEDIIDLINRGNLLYIIGAITGAGAVLAWAIQQVRSPKSWGD